MKKGFVFLLFTLLFIPSIFAQSENVFVEKLIDMQTASILNKGEMSFSGRIYSGGGLLNGFTISVLDNFEFGISYGGANIIGRDSIEWNGNPGVMAKYKFLEENFYNPSLLIGFSNQGYGGWDGNRYDIKSPGFFLALSKNFIVSGNLGSAGIHMTVNYTVTEDKDDSEDDSPDLSIGFDKSIGEQLNLLCEYDFAFNDDSAEDNSPTMGRGYLNLGLRWTFNNTLDLELEVKDILRNKRAFDRAGREIRLMYKMGF